MALLLFVLKWLYIIFVLLSFLDLLYLSILSEITGELSWRHAQELSLVSLFIATNVLIFSIYSIYSWYTFTPPNEYYINYLTNLEHILCSLDADLQLETIKRLFIRERDYPESPLTSEEIALIRKLYLRCRELDSGLPDLDIIFYFREKYKNLR